MKLTDEQRRGLCYEFMFKTALDRAYGADISASEGRAMHRELEEALAAGGRDMYGDIVSNEDGKRVGGNAPVPSDFMKIVDGILENRGFRPFFNGDAVRFNELKSLFVRALNEDRLPLSPYMSQIAHRESVLDAGTSTLWVRGFSQAKVADGVPFWDIRTGGTVDLVREVEKTDADGNVSTSWSTVGPLRTKADICGVSMLRPHMKREEYEAVSEWVKSGWPDDVSELNAADVLSMQLRVRAAAEACERLRDDGVPFSFETAYYPGQALIRLDNNITMRVCEMPGAQANIGRMYDAKLSNARIHWRTSHKSEVGDGKGHYVGIPDHLFTGDLLYRGILWLSGREGSGVSDAGKTLYGGRTKSSRFGKDSLTMGFGDAKIATKRGNRDVELQLHVDVRDYSTPYEPFIKDNREERAQDYLSELVSSARGSLLEAIGLDEVLEAHSEMPDAGFENTGLSDSLMADEVEDVRYLLWEIMSGRVDAIGLPVPGGSGEVYREGDFASRADLAAQ